MPYKLLKTSVLLISTTVLLTGCIGSLSTMKKLSGITEEKVDAKAKIQYEKEKKVTERRILIEKEISKISNSTEAKKVKDVIFVKWDEASRIEIFENLEYVEMLRGDIANGLFDVIDPIAKDVAVHRRYLSSIDAYRTAATIYADNKAREAMKNESLFRQRLKSISDKIIEKQLEFRSAEEGSKRKNEILSEMNFLEEELNSVNSYLQLIDSYRAKLAQQSKASEVQAIRALQEQIQNTKKAVDDARLESDENFNRDRRRDRIRRANPYYNGY